MRSPRILALGIGGLIASVTLAVVLLSPAGSIPLVQADPPPPPPPEPCAAEQAALENQMEEMEVPFGTGFLWNDSLLSTVDDILAAVDDAQAIEAQMDEEDPGQYMLYFTQIAAAEDNTYNQALALADSTEDFLSFEEARSVEVAELIDIAQVFHDCMESL